MKLKNKITLSALMFLFTILGYAQQDPQYTDYMFNTMIVNPAYAGSRGHLSLLGLYRSQWVGLDGAPKTQSLSVDSPVGRNVGLGLSIVNDELGPSDQFNFNANFSYTINFYDNKRLSFGVNAGGKLLNIDWSKGNFQENENIFQENIVNEFLPTIGAGVYFHSEKSYVGLSVPNFLTNQYYDGVQNAVDTEKLHFYLIGGYVFDLSSTVKFKPAFLGKFVTGAPVIVDLSANFMFHEAFRLGVAYRWNDSVSGLVGMQVSPRLMIGYAYDYTTTPLQDFNTGTHEIMLRFELVSKDKQLKSPRFF
ncbi:type IX secretion system membrane protein PorP/SprF [Tamlana sp. 2_MG-2023]|uniref:PorP/SprF family type IX secretion system membrane protein n=1 Tax=unclassified Tamlana TaxID=2614803 RepID=UPI0026E2078C|nr:MULTISPECIES: type IX secretion system membrane protein PorP/SprF [unclassified Tamlana]MDO6760813.1 type IX secretion system membrane protein PorP/SprF [Tamlana sp. 2_MG-2023]MDO6791069.1 type IX secretion system membrane protein PorP/SprF [Tamlana sp. 1_MG-2023]